MASELYLGHSNLPYLSSLRLYLPLESFSEPEQQLIRLTAPPAGERMRADLQELSDSLRRIIRAKPFPGATSERVRSLQMSEQSPVLFNLNQVQPRSLSALEQLREGSTARLAEAVFPAEQFNAAEMFNPAEMFNSVQQGASDSAIGQTILTRCSGWGIPFGWFVLIAESDRTEVVESRSRVITVRVQVPLPAAQERLQAAIRSLESSAPDLDLLEELRDLASWLTGISVEAAVELDYGAIADRIYPDESPSDVRLGLECLAEGDLTGAAAAYRRLASRWVPIRQLSRAS